jgi:uncharacterized membrane protein
MSTAVDVAEEGTGLSKPKKFMGKLMLKALKRSARKMADGSLANAAEIVRLTAQKAVEKGHDAFANGANNRLPIQRSVDVAVPLQIAWEEWLELDSLPEGVDTVSDIERDGDTLIGHIEGPRSRDWEAEVIDEREEQSFAWQSHEGSDCAGLVTFHALSERLTRLELNLDVVPTGVGETLKLSTRLADRRAEAELRRFKARVELINPDVYEDELHRDDEEHDDDQESDRDETEDRDEPQDRGDDGRDTDPDDVEDRDAD